MPTRNEFNPLRGVQHRARLLRDLYERHDRLRDAAPADTPSPRLTVVRVLPRGRGLPGRFTYARRV
ncbi:hypothetical protein [Streptomyces sp. NPDC001415]